MKTDNIMNPDYFVRIKKIEIDNIRGIKHGVIELDNTGKDTQSDILGIYGQNGSGKTTFLEIIEIIKCSLSGRSMPLVYESIISQPEETARIKVVFSIKLRNRFGETQEYTSEYEFSLCRSTRVRKSYIGAIDDYTIQETESPSLCIFDEVLSLGSSQENIKMRMQPIFDTTSTKYAFGPASKHDDYFKANKAGCLRDMERYKENAKNNCTSFIFSNETLDLISPRTQKRLADEEIPLSVFIIFVLRWYAHMKLYVIGTKNMPTKTSISEMIIFTPRAEYSIRYNSSTMLTPKKEESFKHDIESLNIVLSQVIPGMTIEAKKVQIEDQENARYIEYKVFTNRNGIEIPILFESEGIKKIISSIGLFCYAYSRSGITVAIDEFDAGIYEYLLGELLKIFQESGKGQFIFTSHNLIPIETLRKEFICFTTTLPENRFKKLPGIRDLNNLRNVYLRLVGNEENDGEYYETTRKEQLKGAIRKAGVSIVEKSS